MRAAPGSSDFDLLPSPPPLLRRLLPKTIMTTFKSTPFQSLHLQNFQRPYFEKFHIFKTILLPRHVIFRSRKSIPTVLMNLINTIRLKLKACVANQFHWIMVAQQNNTGYSCFSETYLGLKVCSVYWCRREVLPTPELPRARNLIR